MRVVKTTRNSMSLKKHFVKHITATGPITVAAYMADCLMHPDYGYYQNKQVFGADGDFVTAPEISQMFGEMIGLWAIERWQAMDKPTPFSLIELGPGRGTLMQDLLRVAQSVPDFIKAAEVCFVETSSDMRARQANRVPSASWYDDLGSVKFGPAIIIGNEFLDALPIHQFQKKNSQWFERYIAVANNQLHFQLGPLSPQFALTQPDRRQAAENSVLEVCPSAINVMRLINERLATAPTVALLIDYGYLTPAHGDSLQAVKAHKYIDVLAEPGEADITAHVDFSAISAAVNGKSFTTTQGQFLMNLGLGARAEQLAKHASAQEQSDLLASLKRLTAPGEMGDLFKVMLIQNTQLAPPLGF